VNRTEQSGEGVECEAKIEMLLLLLFVARNKKYTYTDYNACPLASFLPIGQSLSAS